MLSLYEGATVCVLCRFRVEMWEVDLCLYSLSRFMYLKKKEHPLMLVLPYHVWACSIMQIIACNSHTSRQRGLMPLSSEMTTTVSNLPPIFGFTCWHFCFCYIMAPLHLCTEAESQGVLDRSPAVLKGLLNLIPVWWSFSVLAPRFPGESQAGKLEPPTATPTISLFLIMFPFAFVPLAYPHAPRRLSPLVTVSEPARSPYSPK